MAITSKEWPAGLNTRTCVVAGFKGLVDLFSFPPISFPPIGCLYAWLRPKDWVSLLFFPFPHKREKNKKKGWKRGRKEGRKILVLILGNCVQYTLSPLLLPFDLKAHPYSSYDYVGVVERKIALSQWWCYIKLPLFNCHVLSLSKDRFPSLYSNAISSIKYKVLLCAGCWQNIAFAYLVV